MKTEYQLRQELLKIELQIKELLPTCISLTDPRLVQLFKEHQALKEKLGIKPDEQTSLPTNS